MWVILRQNVENLGQTGDVVKVSDGYARNYLLPRNLVVFADEKNKAAVEHHKRSLEKVRLAQKAQAEAQKAMVEAQIAPEEARARVIAALSNNLNEDNETADFERRVRLAEIMLKEKDIDSNERIAMAQMQAKQAEKQADTDFLRQVAQ